MNSTPASERRLAVLVVLLTTVAVVATYVIVTRERGGDAERFESEAGARALAPREPMRGGGDDIVAAVESQPATDPENRQPAMLRITWNGPPESLEALALIAVIRASPDETCRRLQSLSGEQLHAGHQANGWGVFEFDYQGNVDIEAMFRPELYHLLAVKAVLVRGETTTVMLTPEKRPVVSGLVVDHQGEPVKGARVRAWSRCKRLQPNDPYAYKVGFAISPSRSVNDGVHLRSFMSVLSDADGRFSGTIGTTEEIAIDVDAGSRGSHTETYEMRNRFADLADLKIVLAPPLTNDRRPRVIGTDGRNFANEWFAVEIVDLSIADSGGKTNCEVDESGTLAFERFEVGKRYALVPRFVEGYETTAFTFEYGMTVVLSKLDP